MFTSSLTQLTTFIIFMFVGVLISIIFDIFRIFRKLFKTSDIITNIEDIIFWIITSTIFLIAIFYFNNGEFRGFIFIGISL